MDFIQANKVTAHEAVIDAMERYIINNKLSPGDSLPGEVELANKLGVSRGIIRSGLQHYKTLGIIASKPKTGAYIKELLPKDPFEGYLPYLAARSRTLPEIGQMRMVMESGMVPVLMKKTTDQDIEKLRSLAEAMASANNSKLAELDSSFHSHLLDISQNELLKSLNTLLFAFFDELNAKEQLTYSPEFKTSVSQEHLKYVKALEDKDQDELYHLIHRHYANYWDCLQN